MPALDPDLLKYATEEELAAYSKAQRKEAALLSPLDYYESISPETVRRFPHTELLNRYAVAHTNHAIYPDGIGPPAVWTPDEGESDENNGRWLHPHTGVPAVDILVLSLPPQHGKTFILTETMPAWYVSRFPDRLVILTAYEAGLAATFSSKNREKVKNAALPGVDLDESTQAKDNWSLKGRDGHVISAGAGGPITGKGGHLIIVDDPVKNAEEAMSESDRKKKWDWWVSTVKTRRRRETVFIIIQTRWHEDDLAGQVIRKERCFHLNIPALAFDGDPDPVDGVARDPETGQRDPLNRLPGEALCPALHPRAELEEVRDRADSNTEGQGGALWFSCLYQGKPTILGGGILPGPFLHYTAERRDGELTYTLETTSGVSKVWRAEDLIRFITADLAASVKTRADWTVMSLWGVTPDKELLLLDVDRRRMETPDHAPRAKEFWKRAHAEHGACRFLGIEDKTFGTSLIQTLVREGGITIRPLKADTDKVVRAIPAGDMMQQGKVFFPRTEAGKEFIKECSGFPNGAHDDMVDTLSYAARQVSQLPSRNKGDGPRESAIDRHFNAFHKNRGEGGGGRRTPHPILGRC